MPDEFVQDGAESGSSPAQTDPQAQVSPNGGAQTTDQQNGLDGQKPEPWHKSPRFQELTREARMGRDALRQNQQLAQQVQQLNQQLQQLQRTASSPARTPEQAQQRAEAIKELKALFQEDPELAELLRMRQEMPTLRQGYQGVQQLNLAQREATVRGAQGEIATLVRTAGLPLEGDGALDRYEDAITGIIFRSPEMHQRFKAGDTSVVKEAFQQLQSFLGLLQLRRLRLASPAFP